MENKICKDCEHFYQHYVFDRKQYHTANCGHCVYPGVKDRRPDAKICAHFKQAVGREVPFKKRGDGQVQIIINCSTCGVGTELTQNLAVKDGT